MQTNYKITRILGAAFLLQFVTSFSSGTFINPRWLVAGDINTTMLNIAGSPWLLKANILLDMITALGVIFLGVMLFETLRKQNQKTALTALGFYILEAVLLAGSRIATFSLLGMSQEYATSGGPGYLLTLGNLAIESMDFVGDTLHVLAFCSGGILFYYLLYKSNFVPRWLSLWGLVAIFPVLGATLASIFDLQFPYVLLIPYIPFEFVIGLWILVKGIPEARSPAPTREELLSVQ
jgi:hypothetical protein